jgi:hypothetical protein
MSEDNVVSSEVVVPETVPENPRMDETDRMALELAKANRKVSLAEAQTALAKNENSELQYKYVVLQIYMKYGLTANDSITEAGEILRNSVKA